MEVDQSLLDQMQRWMDDKNNGRLYAPLPKHPAFDDLPLRFGPERYDLMRPFLGAVANYTALDLGAHWGQFSFFLESFGYKVTAVEHDHQHASILRRLRVVFDSRITVVEGDFTKVHLRAHYDVLVAMGVAHFYARSKELAHSFVSHLPKCDIAFVQGFREDEHSGPVSFDTLLSDMLEHLGLNFAELLGVVDNRPIHRLTRL